ncbi:MAG: trypsin-like serine protease [Gammaproteobacteria bacterium]|nr:trypsin-like serine protease [Gammaproteobacteria bacterium]
MVNIYSTKVVRARRHPLCDFPQFRDLCEGRAEGNRLQNSLGSGVVVSEKGYILTNAHVIANADEILVAFHDNQTAAAEVVGIDPETDLAVIRVNAIVEPIEMGSSDAVRVGDQALAIGNPFGIGQTVSMGIISAKGRYGLSQGAYEDFLQTDAAINPGNSGGALIDTRGRLIGINSLIFSQTGGYQGIGFAVPAKLAMSVLDMIVREGRVIRGWLGVEIAANTGGRSGLSVTSVVRGGPAESAGLLAGDFILAVNQQPALNARAVVRQIAMVEPGSAIAIEAMRGNERMTFQATAGLRPRPADRDLLTRHRHDCGRGRRREPPRTAHAHRALRRERSQTRSGPVRLRHAR